MMQLNLPPYQIRVREVNGRKQIFDVLRRKYIALTPEKCERQHYIHCRSEHKSYTATLLAKEGRLQLDDMYVHAENLLYDNQLRR